jgi:hypothetical protein
MEFMDKKLPSESRIRHAFTCGVCYEIYSQYHTPMISKCEHTFCLTCWQTIVPKKCPLCMKSYQVRGLRINRVLYDAVCGSIEEGFLTPAASPYYYDVDDDCYQFDHVIDPEPVVDVPEPVVDVPEPVVDDVDDVDDVIDDVVVPVDVVSDDAVVDAPAPVVDAVVICTDIDDVTNGVAMLSTRVDSVEEGSPQCEIQ